MGPLGTLFSAIDTTKRKLGDLFSSPVQSAQQMVGYANDRARGLNELTSGAAQEMKQGLLSGGSTYGPQSQQLAQTLADSYNPMGMIKTLYGRIPETGVETNQLADMLERGFKKNQPGLVREGSAISPSQYVTVENPLGQTFQVRISNHADRYPELSIGKRFSVDPATENTFEDAVKWLNSNGVQNKLYSKYQNIPDNTLTNLSSGDVQSRLNGLIAWWRNQPKATRGNMPTIDDVYIKFPELKK